MQESGDDELLKAAYRGGCRTCHDPLSLSQMSSGWRETANRVILSPDVERLQIAVVAARRVIPIARVT